MGLAPAGVSPRDARTLTNLGSLHAKESGNHRPRFRSGVGIVVGRTADTQARGYRDGDRLPAHGATARPAAYFPRKFAKEVLAEAKSGRVVVNTRRALLATQADLQGDGGGRLSAQVHPGALRVATMPA